MTAIATTSTGAASSLPAWEAIDWPKVIGHVRQLQMRIAKAYREGRHGKVKALQWILIHSWSAKLLAVKRVAQNRGGKTPGIDNVVWKTSEEKIQAALSLKRRGYQTQPLKRIYIPKKQKGQYRPLSIPAMGCRGQQALHLLALEPVSEMTADKNAYGFRPLRSTADAIEQCFKALAKKASAPYILEGDIQSCFDSISSQWIQQHIPMDKEMLRKWLAAGYIEKKKWYPTSRGVAQGGVISPTILTITLSGLESAVKAVTHPRDKVNVIVYADDFLITGATREVLESKVKPTVTTFLSERGLSLSPDKTVITHIIQGVDFLGMTIRKYQDKLLIKPSKKGVKRLLLDIRKTIKGQAMVKTEQLIEQLNPKIRGWVNYYRHVCSKDTFGYIDHHIFKALWRWATRRHPNKNKSWIRQKYFRKQQIRHWIFSTNVKDRQGQVAPLDLVVASRTPIRRHVKIKSEATPYDPAYHQYFYKRVSGKKSRRNRKSWFSGWNEWYESYERTDKAGSSAMALQKARA